MSRTTANTLCYYDQAVTDLMMEKYGLDPAAIAKKVKETIAKK